jgi:ribosomal protein L30/L7E
MQSNHSWDEIDEQACNEGMAIDRARKLKRETMNGLGLERVASKSQTKRHGMIRGCIGAKQRQKSTLVPVSNFLGCGVSKVRLSELREEV